MFKMLINRGTPSATVTRQVHTQHTKISALLHATINIPFGYWELEPIGGICDVRCRGISEVERDY
jgi:hypothetical protein